MNRAYLVPNPIAPCEAISVDPEKCTGCNTCVSKSPRKIIWSCTEPEDGLVITRAQIRAATDLEKEAVSRESK